ncbi:NAD(P)-binding protein [Lepidopterella palustris CBS 459.81]|uniref:NAD(P)-binding protein n=1 Tax=Lepidopterella palustris CBS 459.81 TaxID=1314670 RepID=A0A8E2JA67_9PEZI|nr:NAD(P)-binding protein [Lepidopterella palustris CBS 459.81]
MSLTNHTIALTGAASGIGLATAKLLASQNATLSICDYNPTTLAAAVETLSALSPRGASAIHATVLDVRSSTAVEAWIADTVARFGPLHGAANIAGFHPLWAGTKGVHEVSDEEWDEVMNINVGGVMRCLRAQLKEGRMGSGGSIVNFGSVAGLVGFEKNTAYAASKHAVHGLTTSVAKEAAPRGIRVNAVAPGIINTPMVRALETEGKGMALETRYIPLQREGRPEEVAEMVVWLLGEKSSYVTGSVMKIDGGMLG